MGGAVYVDPFRSGALVGGGAFADLVLEDNGGAGEAIEAGSMETGEGIALREVFGGGERNDFRRGEALELDRREALLDAAEERLEMVEGNGLARHGRQVKTGCAQGYGLAGAGV
jgi:hypothetical protein